MATWKLGGVTLASGGKVSGKGKYAVLLDDPLRAGSATVYVASPPDGSVTVDPESDWLLDLYAREFAHSFGLTVSTDYVAKDEDIPPDVTELLAELDSEPRDPAVVY